MSSKALPAGLEAAIVTATSFECVRVDPALSGIQLRRTDVAIVPTNAILFAFVSEQEPKLVAGGPSDRPSVLVVAPPRGGPIRAMDKFDVVWVEPFGDVEVFAKRIISRAGGMLISKGVARRRSDTTSLAHPVSDALSNSPEASSTDEGRPTAISLPVGSQLPEQIGSSSGPGPAGTIYRRPSKAPRARPSNRPAMRPVPADRATRQTGDSIELGRPQAPTRAAESGLVAADSSADSPRPQSPIRSIMPPALHIEGSRWLLLDDDVARAHAVAKALESAGAEVLLSGTRTLEARLARLRQFGAAGVLIEDANLDAIGPLLQRMQEDPWLHQIGLIPIRWQQLYEPKSQRVDLEGLKLRVLPHWQPEHDQLEALSHGKAVSVAQLGVANLLRTSLRQQWQGELNLEIGGRRFGLVVAKGLLWSLRVDDRECIGNVASELSCVLALEQGTIAWEAGRSPPNTGTHGLALDALLELAPAIIATASALSVPKAVQESHAVARMEFPAAVASDQRVAAAVASDQRVAAAVASDQRVAAAVAPEFGGRWSRVVAELGGVYGLAEKRWSQLERRRRYAATLGLVILIAVPVIALGRLSGRAEVQPASVKPSAAPLVIQRESRPVTENSASNPVPTAVEPTSKTLPQGCERWTQASSAMSPQGNEPGWSRVQAKTEWYAARRAIQIGDWDKAERLLCQSAVLDPTGPGAVDLVDLFLSRGFLEQADRWGSWMAAHQARNSRATQMLADVRIQQGRMDEAKALLHESMNISAVDMQVLKQVARKYTHVAYKALRSRDPHQARRLFWRAHVLDAKYAPPIAGLAEVELQMGDPSRAIEWAQAAVALDPDCLDAQLNLGDARAKHGDAAAARQAWMEALRIQPGSNAIRRRLGL